jgi:copper(I)-binding protein
VRAPAVVLLAAAGLAAGCQRAAPALTVERPYGYATPSSEEVAVYFVIRNPANAPDTLVHVNTAEAAGVMFHRNVTDGGVVRMEHLETLVVPPRDSLVLAPGGIHLMLTSVRPRAPGDTVQLSLNFSSGGVRVVPVPLLAPGDPPPGER